MPCPAGSQLEPDAVISAPWGLQGRHPGTCEHTSWYSYCYSSHCNISQRVAARQAAQEAWTSAKPCAKQLPHATQSQPALLGTGSGDYQLNGSVMQPYRLSCSNATQAWHRARLCLLLKCRLCRAACRYAPKPRQRLSMCLTPQAATAAIAVLMQLLPAAAAVLPAQGLLR